MSHDTLATKSESRLLTITAMARLAMRQDRDVGINNEPIPGRFLASSPSTIWAVRGVVGSDNDVWV